LIYLISEFKNLKFPFNVYIEVNQGQPFTPLAPIRKTLVENNQIKVFINSLVKKLTERYT